MSENKEIKVPDIGGKNMLEAIQIALCVGPGHEQCEIEKIDCHECMFDKRNLKEFKQWIKNTGEK